MLRVPFLIAVALSITFFGGIYSALWALDATRGFGSLSVNNWEAYPQIQTADADPYARAHRANDGKILLGRAEGLVFRAAYDKDGKTFSFDCDYVLSGRVPPALFWTLRAIGLDNRPIQTPKGWPSSLNSQTALRDAQGNLKVTLSTSAKSGNWLALAKNQNTETRNGQENNSGANNGAQTLDGFELQLTLIDTPTSNVSGIRELEMPTITRDPSKPGCA